jgi:hypothetical protein
MPLVVTNVNASILKRVRENVVGPLPCALKWTVATWKTYCNYEASMI